MADNAETQVEIRLPFDSATIQCPTVTVSIIHLSELIRRGLNDVDEGIAFWDKEGSSKAAGALRQVAESGQALQNWLGPHLYRKRHHGK